MKRLKSFVAAGFIVAVLSVACPGMAQDGFTQKDRELLIRLTVKMEEMDKRFEQVDKRFDEMRTDTNKRFDELRTAMNARFAQSDKRSEELRADMNARFAQSDKKTEDLRADMNARFEQVDKRFEQLMNFLWILAGIFTTMTVATIGFAYWDRRTMVRKAREETIEIIEKEGRLKTLIQALRKLAEGDDKLAAVLRSFGLL